MEPNDELNEDQRRELRRTLTASLLHADLGAYKGFYGSAVLTQGDEYHEDATMLAFLAMYTQDDGLYFIFEPMSPHTALTQEAFVAEIQHYEIPQDTVVREKRHRWLDRAIELFGDEGVGAAWIARRQLKNDDMPIVVVVEVRQSDGKRGVQVRMPSHAPPKVLWKFFQQEALEGLNHIIP